MNSWLLDLLSADVGHVFPTSYSTRQVVRNNTSSESACLLQGRVRTALDAHVTCVIMEWPWQRLMHVDGCSSCVIAELCLIEVAGMRPDRGTDWRRPTLVSWFRCSCTWQGAFVCTKQNCFLPLQRMCFVCSRYISVCPVMEMVYCFLDLAGQHGFF